MTTNNPAFIRERLPSEDYLPFVEKADARLRKLEKKRRDIEEAHLKLVAENLEHVKNYQAPPSMSAQDAHAPVEGRSASSRFQDKACQTGKRTEIRNAAAQTSADVRLTSKRRVAASNSAHFQADSETASLPQPTAQDSDEPVSMKKPKKSIQDYFQPAFVVHGETSSRAPEDDNRSGDEGLDPQRFLGADLDQDESVDFLEAEGVDLFQNGSADFPEAEGADLVRIGSADFPEAGSADFQDVSRTGSADFRGVQGADHGVVEGLNNEDDMLFELSEFQELADIEDFPMENADEVHERSQAGEAEGDEGDSENGDAASVIQGFQAPLRNVGPPTNRGKKDRRAFELPIRVWIPSNASQGAWHPIDTLSNAIQAKLLKKLNEVLRTKKSKPLWARWTDPINAPSHYNQCIANGLILRKGRKYAENHEACAWCVKKHLLCALLHQAPMGQSIFVGILPLERGLRVGQEPRQISYWIERDSTFDECS